MEGLELIRIACKAESAYYKARAGFGTTTAENALKTYLKKEQIKRSISKETAEKIYWGIVKDDKFEYCGHVLN